jgi:hypothetical protein
MTMASHAVPATRSPRRIYVALSFLCAVIVLVGFWPSYFGALTAGSVDRPVFIHFHAVVYVGWLAIFIAQTVFAATGRIGTHMALGRFAIGYGVLVIGAGLVAAFGMFTLRVRAGDLVGAQERLVGPVLDMLVFVPVFAAAVYYRRRPELHKRLMVVATTALLIAAVGRMPFLGQPRDLVLEHLIWSVPIVVAMANDLWRHRLVHPVYVLGMVVLLLEGRAMRLFLRDTDIWRDIAGGLATWVA